MIPPLVAELLDCKEVGLVIVTLNVPETLALPDDARVLLIQNESPKGFGANHNAAFRHIENDPRLHFFCPINPDVHLSGNPFPTLLATMDSLGAGLGVPLVLSGKGQMEDSLRRFPTPWMLLSKAVGGPDGRYHAQPGQAAFFPEWAAGMFMLFKNDTFARLKGFDEAFFLYYEDVDICVRAWKQKIRIVACPKVSIIHEAQRDSRRKFRYLYWHITSMMRFFYKHGGRLPNIPSADLRGKS
ncbi:hypothetical protein HNQ59_001368 [Chitinivorax tropicus]|uniref:Glycosyl transferase n=1 Tax=Chitinivorax tropicus TaxID=714531 RepID=A0A840MPH6_9PROT|nr:glycosyltransferase family 2 protein [Chitinivorax tropicus]MBB5018083.1 hypothetical protein [Chitinivorax tropicus]